MGEHGVEGARACLSHEQGREPAETLPADDPRCAGRQRRAPHRRLGFDVGNEFGSHAAQELSVAGQRVCPLGRGVRADADDEESGKSGGVYGSGDVEVKDIDRIIVAGDGVASTLGALGLGDKIAAAPEDAVSPEAKDAPEHFEFSKSTGVEGLLAMDGSLFIGDNVKRHGDVAKQFRDAGTDAVVMDDQQSQGDKLKAVAEYVGAKEAGEELAKTVDDQLADAAKTAEETGSKNLSIIEVTATGAGGQNAVAGTGTPGNEMIERLGYTSVGAESKLRGYSREFSNEGIVASAPDVIVMAESDYEKWGGEDGLWKAFPTLDQTPAGQNSVVFVMPDAQLKYSSPEIGVGAQALAEAAAQIS